MNVVLFLVLAICAAILVGVAGYTHDTSRGLSRVAFLLGLLCTGMALWTLVQAGR